MTGSTKDQQDLELLQRILDIHGADRDRWPATDRLRLARVVAENREARRMLGEAAALDRLLDMAPVVSGKRQAALAETIVARAAAQPRLVQLQPSPVRSQAPPPHAVRPLSRPRAFGSFGRVATAASLLAAALVLGIFAGWQTSDLYPGLQTATVETADARETTPLPDMVFGFGDNDLIEEEFL
ncbi:MAG: hypothetical protein JNM89_03260 [Hyphomicrobiaceae bacterium]|nr:hypothetical protein [Hyphomicrobiaceae bacterium]